MVVVCIQEPFFRNLNISRFRYNLYWPSGTNNHKNMQVSIVVRKDILHRVSIDNQINLASHPYCSVRDIKELYPFSRKVLRKTKVINLYNNKVDRGKVLKRPNPTV